MRAKQVRPMKNINRYRSYNAENLLKAYEDVIAGGLSVRHSAKIHGVPEQTLRDRVKGNVDPVNFKKGGDTCFTMKEEEGLVEHLETLAQLGYGATSRKVQHLAGELAHVLGKRQNSNPMSNCWLYAFLKRWGDRIKAIKPQALESTRAKSATPESVGKYFDNLENVLNKYDLHNKPQFIYNLDETGIHPEHRPPNVIAPVGGKAQSVTSPRSTTTTVIGCANAAGQFIPPFFIFKGKRFNPDLMKDASPGSRGVMSDSGWSNYQILRQYLEEHFLPSIAREENQHILLIFDGHASHISKSLIEWAASKKVVLFVLPAHTSHILQPLDVGIFGPFKRFYYGECASFMRENMGTVVTKYHMVKIACRAYLKAMSPINIMAAFRKSGIFPLKKDAVSPDKLYPTESYRDVNPVQKVQALRTGKEAVNLYLSTKYEKEDKTTSNTSDKEPQQCQCRCQSMNKTAKPSAGGKAITEETFIQQITSYELEKEQKLDKQKGKKLGKHTTKSNTTVVDDEQPSTSGLNLNNNAISVDSESDMDTDDYSESELCCVCKKFSPPRLNDRPFLKIVSWAQCSKCDHWVHLHFCHPQSVVRRGDTFLCPHCSI